VYDRLFQCDQLILAQFDFVGNFTRIDNQLSLHIDKVLVVAKLFGAKVFLQDFRNDCATPIDVVFELLGLAELFQQAVAFDFEDFL
jgi:hypothetical protein